MTVRRVAVVASTLIAIAALAGAAALVDDPLAFPYRGALTALIILAACGLAALLRRAMPRFVLLAIAAAAVWQWSAPERAARVVWSDLPAARVAGRHFVVGYTHVSEIRDLSRAGLIGGIFLTRRNVEGRSAADVAAEIARLQADRGSAGLPPLLVAGDQEGGPVTHLSPPLPAVPALSRLAELPPDQRRAAARSEGIEAGRELTRMGVTMDLAPVVDLKPAQPRLALDLHTRIATRAIADDPDAVADIASGFAAGLLDSGVTPTAKHFPGLGSVATDTHLFGAALTRPREALEEADWRPFRTLLAVPGTAVMLSHASLEAVDSGVPASRSRRVIQSMLRETWGFDGIAVTDDLTMGAVIHAGLCRAVEGGLDAGADLLLVSWDTDRIYPALRCALEAVRAGRLDETMLARSAARLDRARTGPSEAVRADGP